MKYIGFQKFNWITTDDGSHKIIHADFVEPGIDGMQVSIHTLYSILPCLQCSNSSKTAMGVVVERRIGVAPKC